MTVRLFQTAALAALLALPAAALAQTAGAAQTQNQPPLGRRAGSQQLDGPKQGGLGGRKTLRQLNLTDAQRQQIRDIEARYAQTFRADREELSKLVEIRRSGGKLTPEQQARARQLREEMRANAERERTELQNVLTPEQRQQIQQRRDEKKELREERREKRNELRRQRRNNNPPPGVEQ